MNVVTRLSSPKSWHGELIEIVLVLVLVLDWFFLSGVASILRTGVQIDFCPDNTDFVPTCPP
jgi:hypothetical protein